MQKLQKGITLVALIITVIIMLILAGVAINLIIGDNGIFKKSEEAKQTYLNEQEKEKKGLDDLYSEMLVATNDDAKITISVEELKTLIDKRIEEKTNSLTKTPVGSLISYMGNHAPEGYLICDGGTYNISEYRNLAEQIKSEFGSYNYYGGDGETTFAIPNLKGEFLRGTNENESAGIHQNEGLPNITGSVGAQANGLHQSNISLSYATGAFYIATRSGWKDGFTDTYNSNTTYYALFDASRSSSIYGNSSHVTPNNTSVLYCIKY